MGCQSGPHVIAVTSGQLIRFPRHMICRLGSSPESVEKTRLISPVKPFLGRRPVCFM